MARVKARPNFGSLIARAGFTRPALAQAADVSTRTVDALANPSAANRSGNAREVTAWKIARAFARVTQQTEDDAFALLFEPLDD